MQKFKEILDNDTKDKIPIHEVISIIESLKTQYTDESISKYAIRIYERIPIIYTDVIAAKDALLECIWTLKCNNDNKNCAFYYDSIWKGYRHPFHQDMISTQLLLIKGAYKKYGIPIFYNDTSPQTIVIYHKYHNSDRSELINFRHLHPFVFNKLGLIPTKNEIEHMLNNFPGYFTEIMNINIHPPDNVTLQKYLPGNVNKKIPKLVLNYDVYPDIYEHLCLDDIPCCEIIDIDTPRILNNIENILSHKVIPNKQSFNAALTCGLKTNAIELLIKYGYVITKDDLKNLIKCDIDIDDLPGITDILLDEDDYFKFYINRDTNSGLYKIFKPELHNKIKLRQLFIFREYNDAIKFMKTHNMQPDRYCLDSIYGSSGNSKKSLINLLKEFKCIPKIGIRQLLSLTYGSLGFTTNEILEICKKNNIDAAYMSSY